MSESKLSDRAVEDVCEVLEKLRVRVRDALERLFAPLLKKGAPARAILQQPEGCPLARGLPPFAEKDVVKKQYRKSDVRVAVRVDVAAGVDLEVLAEGFDH
jgi:hypothetical protein